MKRNDTKKLFKKNIILSHNDFKLIEQGFDNRRLYERQQKNYIIQIKKGFYILETPLARDEELFMIANKIYTPSYISLESALAYYHLIPEGVFTTTSITSKTTRNYKTKLGKFAFHHIQPKLLIGYESKQVGSYKYKIATIEKTIFDFIYLKHQYKTKEDFLSLRIDMEYLNRKRDKNKLIHFVDTLGNKECTNRTKTFILTMEQNA